MYPKEAHDVYLILHSCEPQNISPHLALTDQQSQSPTLLTVDKKNIEIFKPITNQEFKWDVSSPNISHYPFDNCISLSTKLYWYLTILTKTTSSHFSQASKQFPKDVELLWSDDSDHLWLVDMSGWFSLSLKNLDI